MTEDQAAREAAELPCVCQKGFRVKDTTICPAYYRPVLRERDERFSNHVKAVGEFLNEVYAIAIDPLAEGEIKVADMQVQILEQLKKDRESLAELAQLRAQLAEAEAEAKAVHIAGLREAMEIMSTAHFDYCNKTNRYPSHDLVEHQKKAIAVAIEAKEK